MTKEQKDKWLARLRDPASAQYRGGMTPGFVPYHTKDAMCCLAHANFANTDNSPYGTGEFDVFAHISEHAKRHLVYLNDREELSLPQIADWVMLNIQTDD
jgi:hypothetical protein